MRHNEDEECLWRIWDYYPSHLTSSCMQMETALSFSMVFKLPSASTTHVFTEVDDRSNINAVFYYYSGIALALWGKDWQVHSIFRVSCMGRVLWIHSGFKDRGSLCSLQSSLRQMCYTNNMTCLCPSIAPAFHTLVHYSFPPETP